MTTRISPNFRQQILCPQQVSVNTTLVGMDAYKVWTHIVVGTITFTLPAAKKGAGPMYFCEQGAANVIVVQPQSTDLIVGNGVGVPVTLNTVGSFFGVFCEIDGKWSVISASPGVAGAGTVSSVGLADGSATPIYNISGSPVTTAGTLTFTFKTQTANTVLAGPTSGGAAQPAFRTLVAADVPSSILPGGFTGFAIPAFLITLVPNAAGTATTAIRSDARIQLDVNIGPTWTNLHTFNAPVGNNAIRVNGTAGVYGVTIVADPTVGNSFGFNVLGGTSAVDAAIQVFNQAGTTQFFKIFGDGHGVLGPSSTVGLSWSASGNLTLAAPISGIAFTITGSGSAGNAGIQLNNVGSFLLASLDNTNANGGYVKWTNSGTPVGFVGTGANTIVGAALADFCIAAQGAGNVQIGRGSGSAVATTFASAGNVIINAPSSGTALTVNNVDNSIHTIFASDAGTSGYYIQFKRNAGTTCGYIGVGTALWGGGGAADDFGIRSEGALKLASGSTLRITVASAGNVTMAAPASGTTLTVNGLGSVTNVLFNTGASAVGFQMLGALPLQRIQDTGAAGSILELQALNGTAVINTNWTTTATPLSMRINSTEYLRIATTGAVTIPGPASGNVALTVTAIGSNGIQVNGAASQYTVRVTAASGAGTSFGLDVFAGTNSSDQALRVLSQDTTKQFILIKGDGSGAIGPTSALGLSWDTGGVTTVTGAGGYLFLNSSTATNAPLLRLSRGGTEKGRFGVEGTAGGTVTGSAVDDVFISAFAGGNILLSNAPAIKASGPIAGALVDMTPDKGSFTITYTGMTATITGTAVWVRKGEQVQLHFPAATGTSNVNTFTATGLPATIQPTRTQILSVPPGGAQNSGALVASGAGVIVTAASGTATFQLTGSSTGWAASGTKGVLGAFSVAYMLN